jgi:hypothetical protein
VSPPLFKRLAYRAGEPWAYVFVRLYLYGIAGDACRYVGLRAHYRTMMSAPGKFLPFPTSVP